jgi:hypothetical protein
LMQLSCRQQNERWMCNGIVGLRELCQCLRSGCTRRLGFEDMRTRGWDAVVKVTSRARGYESRGVELRRACSAAEGWREHSTPKTSASLAECYTALPLVTVTVSVLLVRAEEEATRRRQYKSTGRCIACMACRRSYCLASKGLGNVHGHRRECYCMTRAEGRSGSSSVLRAPEATMQRNAGWARAGPLRRSETRRLKAASPFAVR